MPADRTKTLKRSDSDESLSWQTPETENTFTIETWTPWADSDVPPPLVDAPPFDVDAKPLDFVLFPPPTGSDSAPSGASTKRAPHSKKKPASHIPRPPNAFILFRSSFIKSQAVSTAVETNHSTLSKIIGLTWAGLAEEERKVWFDKAKEALEEHRKRFPGYAFRPQQARGGRATTGNSNGPGGGGGTGASQEGTLFVDGQKSEKRRVREVEPKDIKRCTKIAQLLVEGKKGAELNAAVAEFDRTHVPQIITRFEAPITERAFRRPSVAVDTAKPKAASASPRKIPRQRRSSSAPVEDTAKTRNNASFLQKVVAHGKSAAAKKQQRSATPAGTTMTTNSAAVFAEEDASTFDASAFNFASFSFDAPQQQLYSPAPCDPLAAFSPVDTTYSSPAPFSPAPYSPVAQAFHSPAPVLSIDTNAAYLTHHNQEDWTSAPGSPFTPSTMGSPMPSQFLEFDAGAHSQAQSPMPIPQFNGAVDMTFDAYHYNGAFEPMQQQQQVQQVQYKEPTTEQAIFAAFQQHQSSNVMNAYDNSIPQFGALDMEFGAFMMGATVVETGYAL